MAGLELPPAHPSTRSRLGLLASGCFVLLVAALPWTIAPMSIGAVATTVLTLSLWLGRPRPEWPRTPVRWTWLAWAIALGCSVLFAIDPAGSWPRLTKAAFPGLVALTAFHTPDRRTGRRVLAVLLVSSAVTAVYGTVLFVAHGASFASRARGPVGHYMTYAGQLLLLVSVWASIALMARERRWRLGALAVALVSLTALACTYTRSAWVGLAVAAITALAVVKPRWLPALAVAFTGAYLFAPPGIRERIHSAFDPTYATNLERTYMWDAGRRMFLDHPLTGVGLQDLHPIYDRYRLPQAHERVGHLHSVPMQIAATMGFVGLAAFVALYGSLIRCATSGLAAMRRTRSVETGLRVGVLAGLAGFLAAGLFEWNFGDEELLYLLFTLAGLAWSATRWERPLESSSQHSSGLSGDATA